MDFHSMLNKLKRDADTCHSAAASTSPSSSTTTPHAKKPRASNTHTNTTPPSHRKRKRKRQRERPFPGNTPVSKVYLVCPPNVQTGGPEAMHQLCHKINSLASSSEDTTITAYMLYLREVRSGENVQAVHVRNARPLDAYRDIYSCLRIAPCLPGDDWDNQDDDDYPAKNSEEEYSDELVIWPECWTHLMDTLHDDYHYDDDDHDHNPSSKRQVHQTAIWWLSVDNNNSKFKEWNTRTDILHLYQSEYAHQHIRTHLSTNATTTNTSTPKHHNRVLPMTEFIPNRIPTTTTHNQNRDLDILYNPLKGIHYTDEILKRSSHKLTFFPIGGGPDGRERIPPSQVTALLHRAKIYIDFGPHPGMDRLPREAALSDCIVITNREGAAGYEEDVPLPKKFKVGVFDVDEIHRLLVECLEEYEVRRGELDGYREWIRGQEVRMDVCVRGFLDSVVRRGLGVDLVKRIG